MPQYFDARDGPVVKAASRALETGTVNHILIWVPAESEGELKDAFLRASAIRKQGDPFRELADDWFSETAVRLHLAGRGMGFTGLAPAGTSTGQAVSRAGIAVETGDARDTIAFILDVVRDELIRRFLPVMKAKNHDTGDPAAGREFVAAFTGWIDYTGGLYEFAKGNHAPVHADRPAIVLPEPPVHGSPAMKTPGPLPEAHV